MSVGTQFGFAHQAYRQFRPSYPERLYSRVLDELGPTRELAVDLGAGTGLVSATLERHVARVVAVEPDVSMAAHLHETAPRVELRVCMAEQAHFDPGSVDLVTCANAFHWMKGPAVAEAVGRWLREGGLFAGWRYPMPTMPALIEDLVRDELPRWQAFLDPRGLDMRGMALAFGARPEFELLAEEVIDNPIAMGVDALIGFLRSVSFIAAFLRSLGPDAADRYIDALANDLHGRIGDGQVVLEFPLSLVLARRHAAGASPPSSALDRRARSSTP